MLKGKVLATFLTIVMFSAFPISPAQSHGGGLDSDVGHNCRVGSCAGTYHCHQAWGPRCGGPGYSTSPSKSSGSKSVKPVCIKNINNSLTKANVAMVQSLIENDYEEKSLGRDSGYLLFTS